MKLAAFYKVGARVLIPPLLIWFVLFEWRFIPYPQDSNDGPIICYSPNHEYYIKRFQSPVEFFTKPQLYAGGIAILYYKNGKVLYKRKIKFFSIIVGPNWSSNSVGFQGDEKWNAKLPTSPGGDTNWNEGCFDEISHYVPPPEEKHPDFYRDLIIKTVVPLTRTNDPFQFQFLFEDQHGIPFVPFYYMIIRADGSRQRGETDKNGRSFVIGSQQDETVALYVSPCQTEECFKPPEYLERACLSYPDRCDPPEDYTFRVNAAKVEGITTMVWDGRKNNK